MENNNITTLEQQQEGNSLKNNFMSKWGVYIFEGFVASLGVTVALLVTFVAWCIRKSKKAKLAE